MSSAAWRIVKSRYAAEAFSGEGARRFGGRWTSSGRPAVYTAEHASLAVLEVLVHLGSPQVLSAYSILRCEFDPSLLRALAPTVLPVDWRASPAPASLRLIGDRWLAEQESAVLGVPSAVLPLEHNYLLNPLHPDFARVALGKAQLFEFDPRLT
ncbi:MAG: RES family NAD+ phosphorylase [Anaerolineales bacterium]|nr:RES family NAD+ phosphorylase [Anaerolineales bacterium]